MLHSGSMHHHIRPHTPLSNTVYSTHIPPPSFPSGTIGEGKGRKEGRRSSFTPLCNPHNHLQASSSCSLSHDLYAEARAAAAAAEGRHCSEDEMRQRGQDQQLAVGAAAHRLLPSPLLSHPSSQWSLPWSPSLSPPHSLFPPVSALALFTPAQSACGKQCRSSPRSTCTGPWPCRTCPCRCTPHSPHSHPPGSQRQSWPGS